MEEEILENKSTTIRSLEKQVNAKLDSLEKIVLKLEREISIIKKSLHR